MPLPAIANVPPMTLKHLRYLVQVTLLTRRATYACFALLLWDMILTLPKEIEWIWPARWTVIKVLYCFNRYIAPVMIFMGLWAMTGYATVLSDRFCRNWLLANVAMLMLCLSLSTFIIVFRLHAAWGSQFSIFITLIVLWFVGILSALLVWVLVVWKQREYIYWEDRFNVCFALTPGLWKTFLPHLVQCVIFLGILIVKAIVTPRSAKTAMLHVLLADGIWFYSCIFCAIAFNVLCWAFADDAYNGLPLYTSLSICVTAVSRLLLDLKAIQNGRLGFEFEGSRLSRGVDTSGAVEAEMEVEIEMAVEEGPKAVTEVSHSRSYSRGGGISAMDTTRRVTTPFDPELDMEKTVPKSKAWYEIFKRGSNTTTTKRQYRKSVSGKTPPSRKPAEWWNYEDGHDDDDSWPQYYKYDSWL